MQIIRKIGWFVSLAVWGVMTSLSAQNTQEEYGKNRIQYHDDFDDWWQYETRNFVTRWYGKSRWIGVQAMQIAENDFDEIQSILEHRLNEKIELLVYVDQTDVKQSNVGEEETFISSDRTTTVSGNKIFVYFDGHPQHLRRQIREGITHIYLDAILFGSNLQQMIQNSVSLKLPEWYKTGLIAYVGEEWSVEQDNALREIYRLMPNARFEKMANRYPRPLGQAFWYYVAKTYGRSSLANIIYLTRINRSLKRSFIFILGVPYQQIMKDCREFFAERYKHENEALAPLPDSFMVATRLRKEVEITALRWSPDQRYLAYVSNNQGKTHIHIYDAREQNTFRIFKHGFRNNIQETDHNYPVIWWHPRQPQLWFVYERKDVLLLASLNINDGSYAERPLNPTLMRIFSADFLDDEHLLMSALVEGQTDLYLFNLRRNNYARLTNDRFVENQLQTFAREGDGTKFLFTGNHLSPDSFLCLQPTEIFEGTIKGDSVTLKLLTSSTHFNDLYPQHLIDRVLHLSEANGVYNLVQTMDKTTTSLSNYRQNILVMAAGQDAVAITSKTKDRTRLYILPTSQLTAISPTYTEYFRLNYGYSDQGGPVSDQPNKRSEDVQAAQDAKEYRFQSLFPDPPPPTGQGEQTTFTSPIPQLVNPSQPEQSYLPNQPVVPFLFPRMLASRLNFKFIRFYSNFDNELLFGGLNTYSGTKKGYEFPPMGFHVKAYIKDIFEDYSLEGGLRLPTTFDGSEYYVLFDNKKARIDKRYAFYRRARFVDEGSNSFIDSRTHDKSVIALTQWSYPFSVYSSLRATGTLRFDNLTLLASDPQNLNEPGLDQQRLGLRLEYIFDNALNIDLNLKNGALFKAYVEAVKKMEIQVFDQWSLNLAKGFMTVLGFDGRYYQRLDRHSIAAVRLTGATSLGSERILYSMGGIENWLFPRVDNDIPVPGGVNYAYSALAANMRGFPQNIRNGTSYLLLNGEVRVPLLKYFFPYRIQSQFLRNFQLIGFADAGTAWHGSNPFSEDNPLNLVTLSNPLVTINVNYSRFPIIMGYGVGARFFMLGYLVRLDYAWGLENGLVRPPRLHVGFGLDF